jgi:hypothetical protein
MYAKNSPGRCVAAEYPAPYHLKEGVIKYLVRIINSIFFIFHLGDLGNKKGLSRSIIRYTGHKECMQS